MNDRSSGTAPSMVDVAVWHPDALVGPEDYRPHLLSALELLCRNGGADILLAFGPDAERPLVEVVCVRVPRRPDCELVATIAHDDVQEVLPQTPQAHRLVELGWEPLSTGRFSAWVVGPLPGDAAGSDALATVLGLTLLEFGYPFGFIDIRLCRPNRRSTRDL